MLIGKVLSLLLIVAALPLHYYTQAQVPCDQCAEAAACFGSGPCAACNASPDDCTGICEGCGQAGPCLPCFEEEEDEVVNKSSLYYEPWPVQVAELPCDYGLDKVPTTMIRGEVPSWLSGTLYHAQYTNSSHLQYDGNLANPSGILAITFGTATTPVAAFSTARGTQWQLQCQAPPIPPFIMDCVVTINQFNGSIASVCAGGNTAKFVTDNSGSISFDGILEMEWTASKIEDTWPYGSNCEGYCPKNLQPEHMPIDANGDVYSLFYNFEPAGYRIFKVPKFRNTNRIEVALVETAHGSPSYIHMGPVPTQNYIILIESPLALDVGYDWAKLQSNFDPNGQVTVSKLQWEGVSRQKPAHRMRRLTLRLSIVII